MDIVVVESPSKAVTVNKYLGKGYKVLASYGHVRDLPAKDGSVKPDEDFAMLWEVDERAERHLKEIAAALKGAKKLYLATDPDREGEAISWHVVEILKQRKALGGVDVQRVVFHEITKDAILEAIKHPRALDGELVNAYLARRALDYLVGFTLSPVLWRKLPGARSAGRVQSVALRLVCEREAEIEIFKPREYWSVDALFATPRDQNFTAHLVRLEGEKLDRFGLGDEARAMGAKSSVEGAQFRIGGVERKMTRRFPSPPFTTSTLQQEASRKLGFGATRTMRTAQRLYEGASLDGETVGLITYMRTDSVNIAREALASCRGLVAETFGSAYVPDQPHSFKSRTRNAQEAHEAIRPTDMRRRPEDVARFLDVDGRALYELVWKRMLASTMECATLEQVAIDVVSSDDKHALRATGSIVKFDGFLKLYQEGADDSVDGDEEKSRILPEVVDGESVATGAVTPEQHFTKPPPRYGEASLVKRLEELGIGRPSTYASILSVLQERKYVQLEKGRFMPSDRGRIVTAFLIDFFERYVEYNFTAELEDKLDDVSNGAADWKKLLAEFWSPFIRTVEEVRGLTITNVIDALDRDLGPHFFPVHENGADPRLCTGCGTGRLGLKLGRHGAFIGCSNYPNCSYTRPLAIVDANGGDSHAAAVAPRDIGPDPTTGKMIALRKGPFGLYVQLGEAVGKEKPKRASLLKGMDPAALTLAQALALLSLPREVGVHPESGEMIIASVGRFGPYLKFGLSYVSLPADDDVLSVGLNRAVTIIAEKPKKGSARAKPIREVGPHPEDGKAISLYEGRYGPYVKHGRINASLPKGADPAALTVDEAVALLLARAARGGVGRRKSGGRAPARRAAG